MDTFMNEASGLILVFAILVAMLVAVIFAIRIILPTTKPGSFKKWDSDTSHHSLSATSGNNGGGTSTHNVPKSAEQMHEDKRQYLKKK